MKRCLSFVATCPSAPSLLLQRSVSYNRNPVNDNPLQFPVGTVVTYGCIYGFKLIGSPTRTCDASGSWTSEVQTCDYGKKFVAKQQFT